MSLEPGEHRDSATTTIAAIVDFVLAGLTAIIAVIFLLIVSIGVSSSRTTSDNTKAAASLLAFLAFVLLVFAVALIFVGVMFVRRRGGTQIPARRAGSGTGTARCGRNTRRRARPHRAERVR